MVTNTIPHVELPKKKFSPQKNHPMINTRIFAPLATALGLAFFTLPLHADPGKKGAACPAQECKADDKCKTCADGKTDGKCDTCKTDGNCKTCKTDGKCGTCKSDKKCNTCGDDKADCCRASMKCEEHTDKLFQAMEDGIRAAVELGKIDEQEARKMMEELAEDRREMELTRVMKRGLDAAVELGKVSKEEAKAMWDDLTSEAPNEAEAKSEKKPTTPKADPKPKKKAADKPANKKDA